MTSRISAKSVKEITKLEKTSLSDFTLCRQSFFTPKNAKGGRSSSNVCAGCAGMTGSVKRLSRTEERQANKVRFGQAFFLERGSMGWFVPPFTAWREVW